MFEQINWLTRRFQNNSKKILNGNLQGRAEQITKVKRLPYGKIKQLLQHELILQTEGQEQFAAENQ